RLPGYMKPAIHSLGLERAITLDILHKARKSTPACLEMMAALTGRTIGAGGSAKPGGPGGFSEVFEAIGRQADDFFRRASFVTRAFAWRWLWARQDEYYLTRQLQGMIDASREALDATDYRRAREKIARIEREANGLGRGRITDRLLFTRTAIPAWSKVADKVAHTETQKQLALAAIAIRRYQLRHGRPPETLAGIVPEFLEMAPVDWMDGAPLRYRPGTNGDFTFYSVGDNFKDDGGDGTVMEEYKNTRSIWFGRDILWPQPATAEEIEAEKRRVQKKR
ncbi:MAG TPA: hypothetical protein VHH73_18105, partial [Verrucomicrobiae bacterium]|nr:hypothetical protein [Verrucomicrobiae bacterium]